MRSGGINSPYTNLEFSRFLRVNLSSIEENGEKRTVDDCVISISGYNGPEYLFYKEERDVLQSM